MKQIFPAFAAAAVVFTIGSSLSLVTGHPEWIARGVVTCAFVFGYVFYRTVRGKPYRR